MLARELISDVIPSIRTSDSARKALVHMEVFRISHLPIVNEVELVGLISDTDIYDYNLAEEPIGSHKLSLIRPFVFADQHVFEVLKTVYNQKLTLVPVLDRENRYLGSVTMFDLVAYFSELSGVNSPGGIIELEMNMRDYSLTEIAQIVESNDAKVLGLYVNTKSGSMRISVTIKVNRTEIEAILKTFSRYDYQIKATFTDEDIIKQMNDDRFEQFMNYLNI